MLKILIEKEFREIISSKKFVYSFLMCSFLIILTFFVGAKNYEVNIKKYEAAVSENIRAMKGITDWRMIEHKIFLPPTPLSSIVSGVSNDVGRTIDMAGRGELNTYDSRYNESPIFAAFRFLDLNFLFQVILSLFAILFAYNAINGEREQGTLKLTFSNAVPRDKYIISKIIGSSAVLLTTISIPLLVGILILMIMGIPLQSEEWIKLILILLSGYLFLMCFTVLSVFVSTVTKKSSTSFLVMLVLWIFTILVIPRASVLIAGRMVDVPSLDKMNAQKSLYNRQVAKESFEKMKNFKLEEGNDPMTAINKLMEENSQEIDSKTRVFNKQLNEERRNKLIKQEEVSFALARISPSACFNFAVSELAGTSLSLIRDFEESANEYQSIYEKFQLEKTGSATGSGMRMIIRTEGEELKEIDPGELPQFRFKGASVSEIISRATVDMGILGLFVLIFFAASYIRFLKYDVR